MPMRQHPLRVLLVIARPASVADVEYRAAAYDIVQRFASSPSLVFEVLRPPTLQALQRRLGQEPKPDIVHFDGHGQLTEHNGNRIGVVLFENENPNGPPVLVRASTFARLLLQAELKTLVLHACRSGQNPTWGPQGRGQLTQAARSFAGEVACHGLRVAAMRYLVPVSVAAQFSSSFYYHLDLVRSVATAFSSTIRDLAAATRHSAPWAWQIPALLEPGSIEPPGAATAGAPDPRTIELVADPRPHWDFAFRFLDHCFAQPGVAAIVAPLGYDSLALANAYGRWFSLTTLERFAENSGIVVIDLDHTGEIDLVPTDPVAKIVIIDNLWAAFGESRGRWRLEQRTALEIVIKHWVELGKRVLLIATDESELAARPVSGAQVVPRLLVKQAENDATARSILAIGKEIANLGNSECELLYRVSGALPAIAENLLQCIVAKLPPGADDAAAIKVKLAEIVENGPSVEDVGATLEAFPTLEELEAAFEPSVRARLGLIAYFRTFVRADVLAEVQSRLQGFPPFTDTQTKASILIPDLDRAGNFSLLIPLGMGGYRIHPLARPFLEKWRPPSAEQAFCGAVSDLAAFIAGNHARRSESAYQLLAHEDANIRRAFEIAIEHDWPLKASQCLWALDEGERLQLDIGYRECALTAKRAWSTRPVAPTPNDISTSDWLSLRLRLSRIGEGTDVTQMLAEQTEILCVSWRLLLKHKALKVVPPAASEAHHVCEVWVGALSAIFVTSENGRLPSVATPRRLARGAALCERLGLYRAAALFCQKIAILNYASVPDEDVWDGDLPAAAQWLERAEALDSSPQNLTAVEFRRAMIEIKLAYRAGLSQEHFAAAKIHLDAAARLAERESHFGRSPIALADVYRELMFVARQSRDIAAIEQAYRQAIRHALSDGDAYAAARTTGNHASALHDMGRRDAAMAYREQAIRELRAIGHADALATAEWYLEQWRIQDSDP